MEPSELKTRVMLAVQKRLAPKGELDDDCFFEVLGHLQPRDILNCSNVNAQWGDLIRGWIGRDGYGLHGGPEEITDVDKKVEYFFHRDRCVTFQATEVLRYLLGSPLTWAQVRRNDRLENGTARSTLSTGSSTDDLTIKGFYATWFFKPEPGQRDWPPSIPSDAWYDGSIVHWRKFPSDESDGVRKGRVRIERGTPEVACVNTSTDGKGKKSVHLVVCVHDEENE